MRYVVIALLALGLVSFLPAQSSIPSASDRSSTPRIGFTPPVAAEEQILRSKIASALKALPTHEEAGGTSDANRELTASVAAQFDYLSVVSDRMLVELKAQVERLEQDNSRRKAAKAELVDAEVARLIHESRRLSFAPPLGALMRNSPGRRNSDSQRAE